MTSPSAQPVTPAPPARPSREGVEGEEEEEAAKRKRTSSSSSSLYTEEEEEETSASPQPLIRGPGVNCGGGKKNQRELLAFPESIFPNPGGEIDLRVDRV